MKTGCRLVGSLIASVLLTFSMSPLCLQAADWPQFRGPGRDGTSPETGLLKSWPEGGPALLWSTDGLGAGYGSACVAERHLFVTGKQDSMDILTAMNLEGEMLWQQPCGRAARRASPEARCTPAVDGNRVYTISGLGDVACFDTAGNRIWSEPAYEKFQGLYDEWEVAESPLIVDDKVIYTPGGFKTTMVALDKHSGETVWTTESLNDSTAYVSPLLIHHGGIDVIVNVTANYVFGVNARNGDILWKYLYTALEKPTWHPRAPIINCNTPLYRDGCLFVTSGYDHVCAMFEIAADHSGIELLWFSPVLDTHIGGVVEFDGYIYGSNWLDNRFGNWCCLEWETGKTMYEYEWKKNKGSVIAADGMLYCYDERTGDLALVRATPETFDIQSTFQIKEGRGPYWAHPSIAGGRLYIRHGDILLAYDIKDRGDGPEDGDNESPR